MDSLSNYYLWFTRTNARDSASKDSGKLGELEGGGDRCLQHGHKDLWGVELQATA